AGRVRRTLAGWTVVVAVGPVPVLKHPADADAGRRLEVLGVEGEVPEWSVRRHLVAEPEERSGGGAVRGCAARAVRVACAARAAVRTVDAPGRGPGGLTAVAAVVVLIGNAVLVVVAPVVACGERATREPRCQPRADLARPRTRGGIRVGVRNERDRA